MPPSGELGGISTRNQGGAPSLDLALCVCLVIVVAPAFVHPSIDVGEWYRAVVRLVNLEFSVAEDPGRRLPQRALISSSDS